MARVWIYDRNKTKEYKQAVAKAKKDRRKPPARWLVRYYDKQGRLKSEAHAVKTRAEERRTELASSLSAGTYIAPEAAKIAFGEIADKWLDARQDLRRSTWWKYRGLLDNHVSLKWGDYPLATI